MEATCGCEVEEGVPAAAPIQSTPTAGAGPTDAPGVSSSFGVSTKSALSFVGITAMAMMTQPFFSG